jgi:hypothetical protein
LWREIAFVFPGFIPGFFDFVGLVGFIHCHDCLYTDLKLKNGGNYSGFFGGLVVQRSKAKVWLSWHLKLVINGLHVVV